MPNPVGEGNHPVYLVLEILKRCLERHDALLAVRLSEVSACRLRKYEPTTLGVLLSHP